MQRRPKTAVYLCAHHFYRQKCSTQLTETTSSVENRTVTSKHCFYRQ